MNKCLTDCFFAANCGDVQAATETLAMIEAGQLEELGRRVLACGKCHADFAVESGFALPVTLVAVDPPEVPAEACFASNRPSRQANSWVAYLSPRWMDPNLLLPDTSTA